MLEQIPRWWPEEQVAAPWRAAASASSGNQGGTGWTTPSSKMGAGAPRGKQVGGDRAGKRQAVGGARLWSKQAGGKFAGEAGRGWCAWL
jgi:hypothetical protein